MNQFIENDEVLPSRIINWTVARQAIFKLISVINYTITVN